MFLLYIVTACITIAYIFLISSFLSGWKKIPDYHKHKSILSDTYISLVIAFRNEERNIPNLIHSILNQSLERNNFEVILVNDHSLDDSYSLCNKLISRTQNFTLLNLTNLTGKKNAIALGIKHSKGSLIVTSDADCTHHTNWLASILDFYLTNKPKMIIGPVLMKSKNFLENIQSVDFYSLMVSGAGAAGNFKPIMCNGANLAFEKNIFDNKSDILNQNFVSGDDIFLMLNLKQNNTSKIMFLKSLDAAVYVQAEPTFKKFLAQRKRWASKSAAYKDKDILFAAYVVFLANIIFLINFALCLLIKHIWLLLTAQFIIKSIVDYMFLGETNKFFKQQNLSTYFIPTQIFNLIMVPYIAISGIFKSFEWKGRKYTM